MGFSWQRLEVRSTSRLDLIDITDRIAAAVDGRADGAVLLFTSHTTAALILNEHEEGLLRDLRTWLERVIPAGGPYAHDRVDDNADAHLRAILLGPSLVVPVEEGRLALGQWQRIFLVELDGPRTRQVRLRLVG